MSQPASANHTRQDSPQPLWPDHSDRIQDPEAVRSILHGVLDSGSQLLAVLYDETVALQNRNRESLEKIYPEKSKIATQYEMAMSELSRCDLSPELLAPVGPRLQELGKNLDSAVARNVIALQAALNAGFRLMDMIYRAAVDLKPIGAGYDETGNLASRRAFGPAPALSINDTI